MSRHSTSAILPLALALSGFCQADTWTGGILTESWGTMPPDNCDPGMSYEASVWANFDPNLPEGTEWDWTGQQFTYSWAFSPDGSGTSSSNYNQSSASFSFTGPSDAIGDRQVAASVNFVGKINVHNPEGSDTSLDFTVEPYTLAEAVTVPAIKVTFEFAWSLKTDDSIFLVTSGTARPQGRYVQINVKVINADNDLLQQGQSPQRQVVPYIGGNWNSNDTMWGCCYFRFLLAPAAVGLDQKYNIIADLCVNSGLPPTVVKEDAPPSFQVGGTAWTHEFPGL